MIGRHLAHYRITAKLGEGGMGEVYLAEDTVLERRVALKVLPTEMASDPERLERFRREATTLAALDHPNIVAIHSVEEADGVHFLTMQLVEGRTLAELIPRGGMEVERILSIGVALAEALAAAHDRGVIHRDLKPGNVMVTDEGRVKVLDFGLAKLRRGPELEETSQLPTEPLTREGLLLGTTPYMSPEQVEGKGLDHRSDVFSLGVILHEMATGRRPFGGDSSASTIAAILKEAPPLVDQVRSELPHHLGRIVRRCLEKEPDRRYQRARDLQLELEDLRRETTAEGRAPSPPPAERRAPGASRLLYAALGLLAAAAAVLWIYLAGRPPAPPVTPGPSAIRSLAVLPLTNLMHDPEQEYFVDGMTEALIGDLSRLGGLRVISRTSAMRYKDTEKSIPEIARELDVDALVEGSVLRAGDRVRITAQLVDGRADESLWVETYDRPLTDVLSLHSEVARAIAARIQLHLTPREEEVLAERGPVDPEAYEAYLRGVFHMYRFTPQGLQQAGAHLQRSLELDPQLAPAHAAMATLQIPLVTVGVVPPRQAMPMARQAALRALELDERSPDAHVALGWVHLIYDLDPPAARHEVERALELDANDAGAHWAHTVYFWTVGEPERALEAARTARRLDPLEALWSLAEGVSLLLLGRDAEAMEAVRQSVELNPDLTLGHGTLSGLLIRQGLLEEGIAELEEYYRGLGLPGVADAVVEGYRLGGVEAAFRSAARRLEQAAEERYINPSEVAAAWALGNDPDKAFAWLERAVEARDAYLYLLRRDVALESLHSDPRFDELTRRLGLPD